MVKMRINISELKTEGDKVIKELADFLHEKICEDVKTVADEVIIDVVKKHVSKQYLRVLLRKFLHKMELKDYFKVISGGENTIIVKERKISAKE